MRAIHVEFPSVSAHTTLPDYVNPFGSTADDLRDMHARVVAAMSRAKKRLAKIPRPGSYWEEPEIHGSGRQVNLRGARGKLTDFDTTPDGEVTGHWNRRALRLPPMPHKTSTATVVTLGALTAIAVGALTWWLYERRKRSSSSPSHVGDGYSVLLGVA